MNSSRRVGVGLASGGVVTTALVVHDHVMQGQLGQLVTGSPSPAMASAARAALVIGLVAGLLVAFLPARAPGTSTGLAAARGIAARGVLTALITYALLVVPAWATGSGVVRSGAALTLLAIIAALIGGAPAVAAAALERRAARRPDARLATLRVVVLTGVVATLLGACSRAQLVFDEAALWGAGVGEGTHRAQELALAMARAPLEALGVCAPPALPFVLLCVARRLGLTPTGQLLATAAPSLVLLAPCLAPTFVDGSPVHSMTELSQLLSGLTTDSEVRVLAVAAPLGAALADLVSTRTPVEESVDTPATPEAALAS